MHGLTEDGKALTHCAQDNRLVIHLHLDKVCGGEAALVLDSNVQVVWGDICPKAFGTGKRRG